MHNPPLVLVADDEPATASLLEVMCTRAGYKTEIANDGPETIEMANTSTPDLILLDVQMPGMNGFEVVEALRQRENTAQIPIIVITAAATKPDDAVKGLNLGADDYLHKPFNNQELLARIRAKIRTHELEQHLQKRNQELDALVHLGIAINRPDELEALAEQLLEFLNEKFKSAASLLIVASTDVGPAGHFMLHAGDTITRLDDAPESVIEMCIEPRILDGDSVRELFPDANYQSGMAVPLMLHETVIGIMATARENGLPFGENDLRWMRSASQQATLAIRNKQLFDSLRSYAELLEQRVEERTAELESAQKMLIRSEKLASLGRLSGEIAHEVNNPLQPIMSSLEDALEDVETGRSLDPKGLKMAMSEVQRIQRTVTHLLDFARPDTGGVRATNMAHLIEDVLQFTSKRIQHANVTITHDLQEIDTLEVNPDQIRQVVLNLIINAADAMSNSKEKLLDIQLWQDNGYAHITVKDTGEGIAPDLVTQIFEPYFSTKDEGFGLGLSISHSLIEAHGGQVDVESKPGVGTKFRISLPLS